MERQGIRTYFTTKEALFTSGIFRTPELEIITVLVIDIQLALRGMDGTKVNVIGYASATLGTKEDILLARSVGLRDDVFDLDAILLLGKVVRLPCQTLICSIPI